MASEGSLSEIRKRFIALISAFHKVENRRVFSEKWNGEGDLTASKQPVSSNVKLIYPLIKWKTIEMSVHVIQQRKIETLCRDREGISSESNKQCIFIPKWIKFIINPFCKNDILTINVIDILSTSMLKVSSWIVCSYYTVCVSLTFLFIWYIRFKSEHKKKKLHLIWLQQTENKSKLMNSIDS